MLIKGEKTLKTNVQRNGEGKKTLGKIKLAETEVSTAHNTCDNICTCCSEMPPRCSAAAPAGKASSPGYSTTVPGLYFARAAFLSVLLPLCLVFLLLE